MTPTHYRPRCQMTDLNGHEPFRTHEGGQRFMVQVDVGSRYESQRVGPPLLNMRRQRVSPDARVT